jgi:hypothetical protein
MGDKAKSGFELQNDALGQHAVTFIFNYNTFHDNISLQTETFIICLLYHSTVYVHIFSKF